MTSRIGIVVPVYNEAKRLSPEYFMSLVAVKDLDLLFVDDGSTDDSLHKLESLVSQSDAMMILSLPNNVGKANAIHRGWAHFENLHDYDFLGFIDADGAFNITDVEFLKTLALSSDDSFPMGIPNSVKMGFDSFWSSRINLSGRIICRSRQRYFLGRVLASLIKLFFKNLPWDTQSGFKLFRNEEVFRSAIQSRFRCRWLFDIELLLRLQRLCAGNYKVWEQPVSTWRDVPGSKVSWRGYFEILKDFFRLVHEFGFLGVSMSKENEIDAFYNSHYQEIMGTGIISKVWSIIHTQMEKPFQNKYFQNILEIGAGNGEHIPYVTCQFSKYFATDIRIDNLSNIKQVRSGVDVLVQDAQKLTFSESYFDRIIVTCLLAHLDKPEEAISELHRVVKKESGYISIYLPCEPGMLLRFVRLLSTHLKARRRGVSNISRLHYLEHRNYFLALDNLISNEFKTAKVKKRYYPFPFLSWNFNLYKIYQISNVG